VWSLNSLLYEDPAPALSFEDLGAALDERFPGRRYCSAVFWDEEDGRRMSAATSGRVEHELFMALRRDPDRIVDTDGVREGAEAEVIPLIDSWNEEEMADQGPDALRQLSRFARREWRARPSRVLVTDDALATCRVWIEPGIAQIEAVFTAPAARGRGYARKLLTKAIEIAREGDPELIFIIADEDDTPKELYGRLGFDPLARLTRIVRGA
jgi:GNAT superfamily N-acetyltransferase